MKVTKLAQDVRRIEVVRETIGDDIWLMVDANQSLTAAEAIRRGQTFQDLGCYWWEEPIPVMKSSRDASLAPG